MERGRRSQHQQNMGHRMAALFYLKLVWPWGFLHNSYPFLSPNPTPSIMGEFYYFLFLSTIIQSSQICLQPPPPRWQPIIGLSIDNMPKVPRSGGCGERTLPRSVCLAHSPSPAGGVGLKSRHFPALTGKAGPRGHDVRVEIRDESDPLEKQDTNSLRFTVPRQCPQNGAVLTVTYLRPVGVCQLHPESCVLHVALEIIQERGKQ